MNRKPVDPYCFPGTNVLRNLPGILDRTALDSEPASSRDTLYNARDRAVMHGDSSSLAALFSTVLSPPQSLPRDTLSAAPLCLKS